MTKKNQRRRGIGNLIAPPRFIAFAVVTAVACWIAIPLLGLRPGVMAGFDTGAVLFLLACIPLLVHDADKIRDAASRNDANRAVLLLLTGAVTLVILVAVASELMGKDAAKPWMLGLIVATLTLSWVFTNTVYALHYAHLFYQEGDKGDAGGLCFPETKEPSYWEFVYFGFCLGMTFQTSDVSITQTRLRRSVTVHCFAAFVFNLGVVAFTINVLGGG